MALNKAQLMETPGGPGVVGAVQAGTGITITGGVISVNAAEAVTQIVAGDNITLSPANGRGVVTISSTGGGGGQANPTPGNTGVTPAFASGDGSQANPFTCTPVSVNIGGAVQSAQLITFSGLTPGQQVIFQDLNSTTNGNRFAQPTGTVSGNGTYTFRLQFVDNPATTGGGTYTAQIKCGTSTVYFRWVVTVLTTGVATPNIEEIQDISGTFYSAPTNPSYLTQTIVGALGPVSPVSGLTPSQTTPNLTPAGGGGTGLTVKVSSSSSGGLGLIEVVNGGTGYTFGQTLNLDLSSIGGGSAVPFYTFTRPVTGGSATFKVSAFQGFNAGSFSESEWQFATEPTFAAPVTTTSTTNATTVTVAVGMPKESAYYARFRYKSTTGVYSEYSPIIRSATGSLIELEYIMKSFSGAQFASQSFDSNPFYVTPKPYLYLVVIDQGSQSNGIWNPGSGDNASSGGPARAALYLQLRQPVSFRVTQLGSNNGVAAVAPVNTAYGLNDYYVLTNAAPFTGGSGTGCSLVLNRNAQGQTIFQSIGAPGQNYQVGDILTFAPPIGNGNNRADATGFNVGTLDSYWDVLIHGVGGPGGNAQAAAGGTGAGYLTAGGGGGRCDPFNYGCGVGGGGSPTYSLYATPGGNGSREVGSPGGGGGGTGWASGTGGSGTNGGGLYPAAASGGGGATFLNTQYVTGSQLVPTSYPQEGIDVFINGALAGSVANQLTSFRLA